VYGCAGDTNLFTFQDSVLCVSCGKSQAAPERLAVSQIHTSNNNLPTLSTLTGKHAREGALFDAYALDQGMLQHHTYDHRRVDPSSLSTTSPPRQPQTDQHSHLSEIEAGTCVCMLELAWCNTTRCLCFCV
jgi:hypothetical protein